jgi:hypothetical protein
MLKNKHRRTAMAEVYLFLKRRALKTRKEENMIPYSKIFLMLSNFSAPNRLSNI